MRAAVIGLLAGCLATLAMDAFGLGIARRGLVKLGGLRIVPGLLGRWILLFALRGRLRHADIRSEPERPGESRVGLAAHYLIGAVLGAAFGICWREGLTSAPMASLLGSGAAYGVLTNALPWLLMYPCMGFGICGARVRGQAQLLPFSFLNHLVFGMALGLAVSALRWALG